MSEAPVMEIPYEFERLLDRDWRECAAYGGRYSLKSHTVARVLLIRARQERTRVGCFREYQNSIADSSHQLLKDLIAKYKLTDFKVTDKSIVNTVNGSDFLFKGLHNNEQSIKSTEGIDIAWVEEAQTVSQSSLEILTPTVRKPGSQIIYTYNRLEEEDPVHVRLVIEGRPNTLILNVNYDVALKYGWMPDEMRLEMEDDKEKRPDLYRHKWGGEPLALAESRIYKGWNIIKEIPHEAKLVRRGLDFGYSNDQAAIIAVYEFNGGLILDEELYLIKQSNGNLADFIANQEEQVLVIADSSEPKSIAEIKSQGVNITGAIKKGDKTGPHKTYNRWAISKVQDRKISVTERSVNLIAEYRKYMWMEDKEGKILNEPDGGFDHALDAVKYAVVSLLPSVHKTTVTIKTPTHTGYNQTHTSSRVMPTIIRPRY